ncbi:TPA: hypothetical protein ACXRZ0_001753 [Klebsiella pneumoniae]
MNKSALFTNAWTIARNAAAHFGGSVKTYFSESLKQAYRSIKTISVDSLIALGGKRWTKNEMDRIYFNSDVIATCIGFDFTTYKTGNISQVSLGGRSISNGRGQKIRTAICCCKFWFDLNDKKFHITNFFQCDVKSDDIVTAFRNAL